MNTRIKVLRSQFRYHSRRIRKRIFNPLVYQVSKRAFEQRKAEFAGLETFLLFIGYPRSGHSLVASLLDAHPQVCLSDELDVLNFLRQGYGPGQLFHLISEHSKRFTQSGRTLSGYSYRVPDSWQGRHRNLKVIGDKSGYEVNQFFQSNDKLPQSLPGRVGLKVKYVHVVRNPFDQITTDARMGNQVQRDVDGTHIQHQIDRHFKDLDCVSGLTKQQGIEIFDLHLEEFIKAPHTWLTALGDFIEVSCDDEYLEKCASMWIFYIALDLAALLGKRVGFYPTAQSFGLDFNTNVRDKGIDFFACINADQNYFQLASEDRAFHVIRDPRDIAVSSYFSHRYSHSTRGWPELKLHRKELNRLSFDEGLIADMEFCKTLPTNGFNVSPYRAMLNWEYNNPAIMEVRYEHLTREPEKYFVEIFRFLGWAQENQGEQPSVTKNLKQALNRILVRTPSRFLFHFPALTAHEVKNVVRRHDFAKKSSGRTPGRENNRHHYRKGVPGDWKNHFKAAHQKYFQENFGDLLVKLGYANDDAW